MYLFESISIGPAFALYNPWYIRGKHSVFLNKYWCEKRELSSSEITALMAHELMHIKNKDGSFLSKFRSLFFIEILVLGYMLLGYLGDYSNKFIPIFGLFIVVIQAILFFLILFLVIYMMTNRHGFGSNYAN